MQLLISIRNGLLIKTKKDCLFNNIYIKILKSVLKQLFYYETPKTNFNNIFT